MAGKAGIERLENIGGQRLSARWRELNIAFAIGDGLIVGEPAAGFLADSKARRRFARYARGRQGIYDEPGGGRGNRTSVEEQCEEHSPGLPASASSREAMRDRGVPKRTGKRRNQWDADGHPENHRTDWFI